MAMVWIALLGGGDYAPEGLTGFGEFSILKWIRRTQPAVYMRRYVDVWVGVSTIFPNFLARRVFGLHGSGNAGTSVREAGYGRVLA